MTERPAWAGGTPVRSDYLVFGSPALERAEIDEMVQCLQSGWIGTGPRVKHFEDAFSRYVGSRYAVAVNSCTAALHVSLLSLDVGRNDQVITSPMTFTATAAAIIHAGADPVFVDIDKRTMNLDETNVKSALNSRTKALLPVHFAGRPCRMDFLKPLAVREGLMVVEDAAHAVETVAQGAKVGVIGDLTCFSFYVTKNVVTGEGGMITTDSEDLASRIKTLALHGMTRDAWHRFSDSGFKHYEVVYPGFKYNMTDMQAALGIHQLVRVERNAVRRAQIWSRYNEAFKNLPVIAPSETCEPGDRHAYHLYTLLLKLEEVRIDRDGFLDALHSENIGAGVHYRALHLHPFYSERFGLRRGMFPNAEFISDRTVSLPLSAKLSDKDVDDVISAVNRILSYYSL